LLAIAFVFMVAASGRDFGPMLDSERRAFRHGAVPTDEHLGGNGEATDDQPRPVDGQPQRALNAVIPVVILVLSVLAGLYISGKAAVDAPDPALRDIIGSANSYQALMWGSFLGVLSAVVLTMAQRIMDLDATVNAWYQGLRSMLMAIIILLLAWSLSEITTLLDTSEFLQSVLGDNVPAFALPALVFLVAALTAFATGSSWGAMGILLPLTIPTTWAVLQSSGMAIPEHMHIFYSAIAAVLAGSVWGDHCSPISDTTILSSLASGCDHIEHVRTQLPYALVVGLVALLAGSLPVALGLPWWLGLLAGLALLWLLLRSLGRRSDMAAN
jgi:Na+/H+ antiporter NhaC